MRDPFGINKMLAELKAYCKEQGFEFPITWLGKRDNILVPFAVPLHLHSDDRQSPYDGHVVFVLNDDVAGIDRVQAYLSQLTEPILLTVQLKKSSLRDKYEGVGMKLAPTRWSDNEDNEYEVYIKGDMDMETFGHLMEQMEYIGTNIIYKIMKEAKFYVDYCFEAGENDSLSKRYQFGIKLSDGEYEELYNVWYSGNCELNSWATEWDGHDDLYDKINDTAVIALRQHLEHVDDITKDPLDTYWELSAETQKAF